METHMDTLPEVGRKYKASCSKVCKSWEAVGKNVSLWKDEKARVDLRNVSTDVLRNLGEREVGCVCVTRCGRQGALKNLFLAHPNISRLDIEFCDKDPPLNIAKEFCVCLPRLKTLTIYLRSKVSAEEFMDVGSRHFPQVENLTLNQVKYGFTLKELCQNLNCRFRNLKKLVVGASYDFFPTYSCLGDMLPSCGLPDPQSHIQHLKICETNDITCPTWDWFDQSFPSLKRLWLFKCCFLNFNQLGFLSRLLELHTLDLEYCSFRDKDIGPPGFCCPTLLCLSISLPKDVKDDDMVRLICHWFPSLKQLELINCVFSDDAIIELASNLSQLEKLSMLAYTGSLRRRLEEKGLGHLLRA